MKHSEGGRQDSKQERRCVLNYKVGNQTSDDAKQQNSRDSCLQPVFERLHPSNAAEDLLRTPVFSFAAVDSVSAL